ncbi:MAG: protein kinase [Myxococcales bacterium]|nr:protein kinase [Myxococcales bacterium]
MAARFIKLGEPAHDSERQALRFLVDSLPATFTVYGNAWLVERSGVVHELDAVVVGPHAVFVVEIKGYRGTIEGTDYDWYLPEPVKSPIEKNRKTAQILHGLMKRVSYEAGQLWTQGLVFLSATTRCNVRGPASKDRIHTRATIIAALTDPAFVDRIANRAATPVTARTLADVDKILTSSAATSPRPTRRIREYEIQAALESHDTCQEFLATHTLSGAERLLRVYTVPPLADDEERERIGRRARWEAQVLGRLGRISGILAADPPFADEAGIVLPLERFHGVSLASWADKFALTKKSDYPDRIDLWLRIAAAVDQAHQQGVVHRLLRPEVVLVDNVAAPAQLRVIGWDLAKQLAADGTVMFTSLGDDRLRMAAPEVVHAFSSASPASDQFSLGAILAHLVAGRPLFESTRDLLAARRVVVRLRDIAPRAHLSLDEAVHRMLAIRPADRFPTLSDAIAAVRDAIRERPSTQTSMPAFAPPRALDPDNLERGTRIGADYEITDRLGEGGLAVVYAARHLPTGRTRALKVARNSAGAEEALRGEYQALSKLDHPAIVKVLDPTNMVDGRLTLIMERVSGETLRQRLHRQPPLDPQTRRRFAEDLLTALDYLEQRGVTHKDLKPDNLLVGDAGLTVIDFSLAEMPAEALYGGTALYRDPSRTDWTHATDRYAAALCLFELYAGRHAFDGKVPEPGQSPSISPEDIDPPGLAAFFTKALHPEPELRFPAARAMRDALLVQLGADVDVAPPTPVPAQLEASSSLRLSPLPPRAQNQLARAGVTTVGELAGLSEAQIRGLSNLGDKTIRDILAFQAQVRARGVAATAAPVHREPAIVPELIDSPEPLDRLSLPARVRRMLEAGRLTTIGAVARQPRTDLRALDGVGPNVLTQIVDALHRYRDQDTGAAGTTRNLDALWDQASQPLTDAQRIAVDRFVGVAQEPEVQGTIAETLGVHQSTVSTQCTEGLTRLIDAALADVLDAAEQQLDARGGVALLAEVGARLEEQWLPGQVTGRGILRLLVKTQNTRFQAFPVDGVDGLVLARPAFDKAAVRSFVQTVFRLATWPPIEADAARRTLAATLPEFGGDLLQLATRLCTDVDFTNGGQLFHHPLMPIDSIGFLLRGGRDDVLLTELRDQVRAVFGDRCPFPEPDDLLAVLHALDYQVRDGRLVPIHAQARGVRAPEAQRGDDLPPLLGADRPPEVVLRDLLREAAASRGFRMLVTPPERHVEISRSVASALGGTYVSFEDAFFRAHGHDIAALERAEQYAAQRAILTEHAETLVRDLLEEHGRPGHTVVLGETALLGLCGALDVPRWLYDEAMSGALGFWVLVVPGVILNRQPRFNENESFFHLEGVTFPLPAVMPVVERGAGGGAR